MVTRETSPTPLQNVPPDGGTGGRGSSSADLEELLSTDEAARRLGVSRATFYDWLGRSRHGMLELRGQRITIDYLQGGAQGQGRIRIEAREVQRLRELMRVLPRTVVSRKPIAKQQNFPGISVPLGRPNGR